MTVEAPRAFLLDANVFIDAKRRYYPFSLCPGFWDCLVWYHGDRRLHSIDRVKAELERGGDDLADWVRDVLPAGCFLSTDDATVIGWFGQMQTWAQAQPRFTPTAKTEFASVADCWMVAHAKAHGLVIVTGETFDPNSRKRIKIPNVCQAFEVEYVDTFQMLNELGVRFTWEPPASGA